MPRKRKRLKQPWVDSVELKLRGFPCAEWHEGLECILHSETDPQKTFDNFVGNLLDSLGRRYFPVYRMADGEFLFCLGWRPPVTPVPEKFQALKTLKLGVREKLHELRGFGTMWGENYNLMQTLKGRRKLVGLIQEISRHGMLALYFMRRGDFWGEQFIQPMLRWFRKNSIELTARNYLPFYMVYAALCGPENSQLFAGRKVLVATGADHPGKECIAQGLKDLQAGSVEFLEISPTQSMFTTIDINRIRETPEIVLTGAGVGSANIIAQMREIKAPVIDAGIFLETLIDPSHKDKRPFLKPA